jgi:hypothetical protein
MLRRLHAGNDDWFRFELNIIVQNSQAMNRLLKIAGSGTPGTAVQFCDSAYGADGIRRFLRDVLAMANASVEGRRYIITGVSFDKNNRKKIQAIDRSDFSGKPSYQALVNDFIEPPVRVRYQPVSIDGKRVGVYEIGECGDRPYMMRADYSETLRRGDAYIRMGNASIKMGRRQMQEMFEHKFRESIPSENIEIGFPGEIIHKDICIPVTDFSEMPSAIAGSKLRQLLEIRKKFTNSGSTTVMARLTHARLFGSDSPYEDRDVKNLVAEMAEIRDKHRNEDDYFLYESRATKLQLVIYNQGSDPIENASMTLVMPNHNSLYIAMRLPMLPRDNGWIDRGPAEQSDYPIVTLKDDSIHVSNNLGDVSTGAPAQVFETPLRICVGQELKGRKLGIRYSLFGSNLRKPATGKLRLIFV